MKLERNVAFQPGFDHAGHRAAPRLVARRFPEPLGTVAGDWPSRAAIAAPRVARGRGGPRSISPRIYRLVRGSRAEKNRRKTARRRAKASRRRVAAVGGCGSSACATSRKREARPRRAAARPPVAAPRGFFLDPRARFYSAHGKQFCPIINRAIVGGWLYARGAFHTSECNGNQIERRRARGPSAGVNTR